MIDWFKNLSGEAQAGVLAIIAFVVIVFGCLVYNFSVEIMKTLAYESCMTHNYANCSRN